MPHLKIKIHLSLRVPGEKFEYSGNFTNITIIEAIRELLKESTQISDICLKDGKRRPGLLYLSGKTELSSLGLLESSVDEINNEMIVRIIPILHGG